MSRKKFKPKGFEKIGSSNLSSTLYASMLQSDAFLNLSSNAMKLYVYMKLQYYGQHDKPLGKQDHFFFNRAMYTKIYPIFSNGEQFAKYSHELIKNGFIEEIENGKNTRTKSIYKFSDKWQSWKPGEDFRNVATIKHDEKLKNKRREQELKRRNKS